MFCAGNMLLAEITKHNLLQSAILSHVWPWNKSETLIKLANFVCAVINHSSNQQRWWIHKIKTNIKWELSQPQMWVWGIISDFSRAIKSLIIIYPNILPYWQDLMKRLSKTFTNTFFNIYILNQTVISSSLRWIFLKINKLTAKLACGTSAEKIYTQNWTPEIHPHVDNRRTVTKEEEEEKKKNL